MGEVAILNIKPEMLTNWSRIMALTVEKKCESHFENIKCVDLCVCV